MARRAMDVLTIYTWLANLAMCCGYVVVHHPPGTPPNPDPSIVFVVLVSIFWLTGIVAILVHCFVMLVFLVRRRRWFWLPLFIWFHFGSTIAYLRFRGEF